MERAKLKSTIEAVLFACGTPVEADRIAQALEISADYAADVCEELLREYADRDSGIRIVRLNKSYQMCTREEYAGAISLFSGNIEKSNLFNFVKYFKDI